MSSLVNHKHSHDMYYNEFNDIIEIKETTDLNFFL